MGSETGTMIGIGQRAVVKLTEAAPISGGLVAELVSLDDKAITRGHGGGRGRPVKRKISASKKKAAKTKRKVSRKRSQR